MRNIRVSKRLVSLSCAELHIVTAIFKHSAEKYNCSKDAVNVPQTLQMTGLQVCVSTPSIVVPGILRLVCMHICLAEEKAYSSHSTGLSKKIVSSKRLCN